MRLALLAAALCLACLPATAQEMRPGQYKTITTSSMGGKPIQDADCVTKADIDQGLARMGQDKDSNCKATDIKRGPGTASYKLTCAEDGMKSTGDADIRMTADSFDYTIAMKGPMGPMKINVRGTRVGDCRK